MKNNELVFCTLFDSNYLDKGIVMFNSLSRCTKDFVLYVLPMDELCSNILKSLNLKGLYVIDFDSFLSTMNLREEYETRPRGEFCWTCTSFLIDYVISKFKKDICTYLDSDLYFYNDPRVLLEEMGDKTVQIVEHRFSKSLYDRVNKKKSGNYCVEFNTFKNNEESMALLRWWESKCRESCAQNGVAGVMGDQLYLQDWGKKDFVSVLANLGGGMAPWNIGQYKLVSDNNDNILFRKKRSRKKNALYFYHFHNIIYLDKYLVNISVYSRKLFNDKKLVNKVYIPYLQEINKTKNMLNERFGFYPLNRKHPGISNPKEKRVPIIKKMKNSIKTKGFIDTFSVLLLTIRQYIILIFNKNKDLITIDNN